jgi:O-antigen ligase
MDLSSQPVAERPGLRTDGLRPAADVAHRHRQPEPSSDRLVFWSLALLVALLPLPLGSNRPWAWSLAASLVGLLLVAFGVGRFLARPAARRGAPARLGLPLALFAPVVLWTLVQMLPIGQGWPAAPIWAEAGRALGLPLAGHVSVDSFATASSLMRLLSYCGIFALAALLARPSRRAFAALNFLVAVGAAYAAYGLIAHVFTPDQLLWFHKWTNMGKLTSSFVNPNSYAAYAGLGLLSGIALLAQHIERAAGEREGLPRRMQIANLFRMLGEIGWFPVIAISLALSAVLLTHSRGGFTSVLVGIAVLLALLVLRMRRRSLKFGMLLLMALVALGLQLFVGVSGQATLGRLDATDVSSEGRLAVYALVLRGIQDAPLTGHGLGSFAEAFQAYQDGSLSLIYHQAHNDYLEAAFELGIPAAALLVATIVYLGLQCLLGVFRRRRDAVYPALAAAAAAQLAAHSLVDFSLQIPAISATFAFILGLGYAQAWSSRSAPADRGR